ncbi:hypothetical protein K239x_14760 [Planctomycetes bacterium K23_9]|uniref:Uncharacterized protein n=1 Tax=Stieleria marina TaxID=1930275 RepID=A0A517NQY3_9BACT|nr:hypothetical protein K239x_14760 [Planctomycetes bacterium K23_9]
MWLMQCHDRALPFVNRARGICRSPHWKTQAALWGIETVLRIQRGGHDLLRFLLNGCQV